MESKLRDKYILGKIFDIKNETFSLFVAQRINEIQI